MHITTEKCALDMSKYFISTSFPPHAGLDGPFTFITRIIIKYSYWWTTTDVSVLIQILREPMKSLPHPISQSESSLFYFSCTREGSQLCVLRIELCQPAKQSRCRHGTAFTLSLVEEVSACMTEETHMTRMMMRKMKEDNGAVPIGSRRWSDSEGGFTQPSFQAVTSRF